MFTKSLLALVAIPALVSAHFQLVYPLPRGTDDEHEYTGPCAGYEQTQNRTAISPKGFNLQLNLGHDRSLISVLLAVGNEANGAFNTFIYPTVQEEGPGDFCFPSVTIPSSLNVTDGTNGTIQVITDGHGGGLYMCSDVTFSSNAPAPATSCQNGTGLVASYASDPKALSNVTTQSGGHGSDTGNGTSGGSGSGGSGGAAGLTVGWGLFGATVLAMVAAL